MASVSFREKSKSVSELERTTASQSNMASVAFRKPSKSMCELGGTTTTIRNGQKKTTWLR